MSCHDRHVIHVCHSQYSHVWLDFSACFLIKPYVVPFFSQEKEELKRAQMKLEETRRVAKRPALDLPSDLVDRKRREMERRYESSSSSKYDDR